MKNEKIVDAIRQSGKRYLIMAQAGVGKTTAVTLYPEILADVDCFLMRRKAGTPPPPAPLVRDPEFPINYVRALAKAFETHPVVVSPIKGNWAIEPAVDIVPLLRDNDMGKVQEYVRYMMGIDQRVLDTGKFPDTPEFNAGVERMTREMLPLLEKLRAVGFQAVLTIPDKECFDAIIANIESRDKTARAQGTVLGQEFRGMIRETAAVNEALAILQNRYETGLYSKMPMHKGQHFADALNDWFCRETVT